MEEFILQSQQGIKQCKVKNGHHARLLKELQKRTPKITQNRGRKKGSHSGSNKYCYGINATEISEIAGDWCHNNENVSYAEYQNLLTSLFRGCSHEELSIAGKLLEKNKSLRKQIPPEMLDKWLDTAEGWAEVDHICQSNFKADELLANWNQWSALIKSFASSPNIHKRRASLVLLVMPVRHSSDRRLSVLAFETIQKHKGESDILITKAISWLLRSLAKLHRSELVEYVASEATSLPTIAVREVMRKLKTGRK